APSRGSQPVKVGLRAARTLVSCFSQSVAAGKPTTCAATVNDSTATGTAITPIGSDPRDIQRRPSALRRARVHREQFLDRHQRGWGATIPVPPPHATLSTTGMPTRNGLLPAATFFSRQPNAADGAREKSLAEITRGLHARRSPVLLVRAGLVL